MLTCSTSHGRCSRSRPRWSESHCWSAGTNPAGVCRRNGSGGSSPVETGSVWLPSEALESACIRQSSKGSTNAGATAGPNLHSSHKKRIPPIGAKATLQGKVPSAAPSATFVERPRWTADRRSRRDLPPPDGSHACPPEACDTNHTPYQHHRIQRVGWPRLGFASA